MPVNIGDCHKGPRSRRMNACESARICRAFALPNPRIRHRVIDPSVLLPCCCPAVKARSVSSRVMRLLVPSPSCICHFDRQEQSFVMAEFICPRSDRTYMYVYALVSPSDSTHHSSKRKYVFTLQHPSISLA